MNNNQIQQYQDDEIDIIELIKTILRYWKFILVTTFIITFSVVVYSLIITPQYTATTKFFIPEMESQPSYMSRLSSLGLGGIIGGGNTSVEIIINMLNSRRMAKDVLRKFNLIEIDNPQEIEIAIKEVQGSLVVAKDKTNFITLSFTDVDPKKAALIANFFVQNLDQINEELQISSQKPLVQILDKADVPVYKSKPKRKQMVIIGFISSIILSIFSVFTIEYIKKIF